MKDITDEEILAAADHATTHDHPAAVRALLTQQRAAYAERLMEESLLVVQMKRERDDALARAVAAEGRIASVEAMAEEFRVQRNAASDLLEAAAERLKAEATSSCNN
jgi:hypothetical protein